MPFGGGLRSCPAEKRCCLQRAETLSVGKMPTSPSFLWIPATSPSCNAEVTPAVIYRHRTTQDICCTFTKVLCSPFTLMFGAYKRLARRSLSLPTLLETPLRRADSSTSH